MDRPYGDVAAGREHRQALLPLHVSFRLPSSNDAADVAAASKDEAIARTQHFGDGLSCLWCMWPGR